MNLTLAILLPLLKHVMVNSKQWQNSFWLLKLSQDSSTLPAAHFAILSKLHLTAQLLVIMTKGCGQLCQYDVKDIWWIDSVSSCLVTLMLTGADHKECLLVWPWLSHATETDNVFRVAYILKSGNYSMPKATNNLQSMCMIVMLSCGAKIMTQTSGPQMMSETSFYSRRRILLPMGQSPAISIWLTLSDCFQPDRSFTILYHCQDIVQRQARHRQRLNFQ